MMKKHNKLEIIGFIIILIGTILWVSESSLRFDFLTPFYVYGQIMFWIGMLIWSLGYMQKEKTKQTKSN